MTTIVQFDCGCIGTEPDATGSSVVLRPCDGDGVCKRIMDAKTFAPVEFREQLLKAFADQEIYREVRQAIALLMRNP